MGEQRTVGSYRPLEKYRTVTTDLHLFLGVPVEEDKRERERERERDRGVYEHKKWNLEGDWWGVVQSYVKTFVQQCFCIRRRMWSSVLRNNATWCCRRKWEPQAETEAMELFCLSSMAYQHQDSYPIASHSLLFPHPHGRCSVFQRVLYYCAIKFVQ